MTEWTTIEELTEELEKDPEMKAELDKARKWYQENREELLNNLVVKDITPKREEDHGI